jgi:hypothetical protein
MIAGTLSAPGLSSRRISWALFWQLARIALETITRDRTANAQSISRRSSKKEIEMLATVSRLVRPQMAILALWATINMFATSAALAQEVSSGTSSAPSVHASAEPSRSTAALAGSATQSPCAAKNQRWMERSSLYVSTLQDFTPMTTDGCQFIRAELLDTNGPTGGWCWRITTACDQYLQGDCWYTSEASAVHAPTLKSIASTR